MAGYGSAPSLAQGGLYLPGLSGHFASTPDEEALRITGDIDLRVRVALADLTDIRILLSRFTTANNGRSYVLYATGGRFQFRWYEDGITSKGTAQSAIIPAPFRGWVRATLDVDNGVGGHVATIYTAPDQEDMPSVWTPSGSPLVGVGVTSIHPGSARLAVGNDGGGFSGSHFAQLVFRAQVRDGIDGEVVADARFAHPETPWVNPNASYHDGQRVWTVTGTRWEWRRFLP